MPELSEVETYKKYMDKTSLKLMIKDVQIRDTRILKIPEELFVKALKNKKFEGTIRHGKYLLIKLENQFLIMHFGMTGNLEYFEKAIDEPKYTKVLFKFTNGHFLSYISKRLFGHLDLTTSVEDFIAKKKLGPDAYKMSCDEFKKTLVKRTAIMKSALLNQSIFAGIGNIYSDEILFQSKLNPKKKINTLDENELKELFQNIKKVLQYGIDFKGKLENYSKDLLIPHRSKAGECPKCTSKIERYEISGRHGFFCPECQK
ncbi:MAG: Fpg/Nei family DNA glycosylase [Promethearchaeota archaeon]